MPTSMVKSTLKPNVQTLSAVDPIPDASSLNVLITSYQYIRTDDVPKTTLVVPNVDHKIGPNAEPKVIMGKPKSSSDSNQGVMNDLEPIFNMGVDSRPVTKQDPLFGSTWHVIQGIRLLGPVQYVQQLDTFLNPDLESTEPLDD